MESEEEWKPEERFSFPLFSLTIFGVILNKPRASAWSQEYRQWEAAQACTCFLVTQSNAETLHGLSTADSAEPGKMKTRQKRRPEEVGGDFRGHGHRGGQKRGQTLLVQHYKDPEPIQKRKMLQDLERRLQESIFAWWSWAMFFFSSQIKWFFSLC